MDGEVAERATVLHAYLDACATEGVDPDAGCRGALERSVASGSVAEPRPPPRSRKATRNGLGG